jgi:hypothetical protein
MKMSTEMIKSFNKLMNETLQLLLILFVACEMQLLRADNQSSNSACTQSRAIS